MSTGISLNNFLVSFGYRENGFLVMEFLYFVLSLFICQHIEIKRIGSVGNGTRGYTSFQFLEDLIVAMKAEEDNGTPIASYISVFRHSDGKFLIEDEKFEGLSFYLH